MGSFPVYFEGTLPADGFDSGNVGERPKFLICVLTLRL